MAAEAHKAEDAVSDALHERLTQRFVDRRAAHLIRRLEEGEEDLLSAVTRQGEVLVEGHAVGRIEGFVFHPDTSAETEEERKLVLRAARRALREEMPRRVAGLEAAKDEAFALTPSHRVTWEGAEVARLRQGSEPGKPLIEVLPSEFLDDGNQRERIRARLASWIEGTLAKELAAIATVETKAEADNTLRGPAFLLREQLGLAPGNTDGSVNPELRQKLKAIGIRAGRYALFVPEALKPRAMALRAQLWALSRNIETPALPNAGLVSLAVREAREDEVNPPAPVGWPPGFAETIGWVPAGKVLIRLDVAERIAGELAYLTRRAPAPPPPDLASRLGVKGDALAEALNALGFRLLEPEVLAENMYGPPTPLRIAQPRPSRHGGRPDQRRDQRGPRQDRQRGPRPDGAPQGERPQGEQQARPQGERPPRRDRDDRPRGDRPYGDRPRGDRPHGDRPQGDRPQGERPQGDRPREDRGPRRDDRGPRRDDRFPREDRREQQRGPVQLIEMVLPDGFYGPPRPPVEKPLRQEAGGHGKDQRGPRRDFNRGPGGPGGDKRGGPGGPGGGPRPERRDGPPRGDRPFGGDRRDRDRGGDRQPREQTIIAPSNTDAAADSPFAVLARLKLK